ncbi:fatty acyl-AMP ligase [Nocardia colli]|uniref:Fatty acyl-AMP ligase n=1 Tax=Nocardia colli TaxID=2545717 RepID=A0A5N0ELJ2_9NOCA|nr:fatty acyl-AMP ligase [Nocardia colli]KAA8888885.1 fatty acyl-AMP ligase [Nocardia colli]
MTIELQNTGRASQVDDPDCAAATTLVELLTARALRQPDDTRFIFLGDGENETSALTYAAVDTAARAIAARLGTVARQGDRALLLYAPGLDFVEAFYGCLYAGIIAVPVAPPQISKLESSLARLAAIRANAGAQLMLTTSDIAGQLAAIPAGFDGFAGLETLATDTIDRSAATDIELPVIAADSVAYLQYSSGSTGQPKGVVLTHHNVLSNNALVRDNAELGRQSWGVSWLPTYHDMGLLSAVTQPIFSDSTIVKMSPLSFVQQPVRWIAALAKYQAVITAAPNFAYALAVQRVSAERVAQFDLSQLKIALCGAEPIRPAAMAKFAAHFAPAGLDARSLFPCYGLAEATLFVTGGPLGSGVRTRKADPEQLAAHRFVPDEADGREIVSSGRTNDGFTMAIVDHETLHTLPDGQIGEICIAGDSVGQGYWESPELSAESFGIRLPDRDGSFLRTGDLGFLLDDELYVTGRLKDLIIVDGHNHYPTDIEATVMASHDALRLDRCVAFQVDGAVNAGIVVVAEIDRGWQIVDDVHDNAAGVKQVQAGEVDRAVRAAVGEKHGLRPSDVVLVEAGTLPLTSSGKLQRYAAKATYTGGGFTKLG